MAAHVVRLRLAAALNPFRSAWRGRIAAVLVLLATAVAAGAAAVAALALAGAPGETARVAIVCAGSLVVAGFFLAPFASSRPDTLDPAAFAVLPLSPAHVASSSAIAGLVSLPILAVVCVDIACAVTGAAHGTPPGVAASGAAMHALTCVLAARIGYLLAVRVRMGGRSSEGAALGGILALAIVVPAVAYALSESWHAGAPALARAVADALAVTPLGAGAAVMSSGAAPTAPLIAAGATLIALALAWWLAVRRAFSAPPASRSQQQAGLGWLGLLPRTAAGMIGARGILYWATDVRHLANVAIVPVAGLAPVVPLLIAGVPADIAALVPLPIIAGFLGWIAHNDLAYDSEALWLHLVSGVRGVSDRAGRLVPITLIAIPMLSAAIALTASFAGAWDHLPTLIGVALALFLSGLGLSSISSAAWPYAVARPGDSPFRQPQRIGARGAIAPGIVLLATFAIAVPTMIPAFAVLTGSGVRDEEVLLRGALTGVGVLIVGVLLGALVFDRRGHRLVEVGRAA
ncbi:hypothetical protein [Microbacterium karelineae]|uniref:hypothetical protein n=1 Tax=Microbacterium karelineae TaxID=2654283 RepID=UPI0012E9A5C9|nr:hypothetical protein [Microbacterium karelineae]